ncbi:MAG: ZPR1 zinc finger domain-containing protein [Candidatus Woesearchaeota archaeon]
MTQDTNAEVLEGERCPFCLKNTLTLRQAERDVPYFGKLILFSMNCEDENCDYFVSDVEAEESKGKVKCSFTVESEDDLKVRVIKSSTAKITIPRITTIEPTDNSSGYVTNIEGILNRVKKQIENVRDTSDDNAEKKKAKNLIKKLTKILWGQESITISLEDPHGNSSIISEKTVFK